MDGTLPKFHFLKLQGRGAPIPPLGWMEGVFWTILFYNLRNLPNEGSKLFEFARTWFLSCENMGIFWRISDFGCFELSSEKLRSFKYYFKGLKKNITCEFTELSTKVYEKYQIGSRSQVLYASKSIFTKRKDICFH